ncbi:MAG TPA: exosortase/archaeosortase family protein [Gemmataceae bacterium]|nr:exosortase/archaeosortase family protein [Gemmataceae bacterium]
MSLSTFSVVRDLPWRRLLVPAVLVVVLLWAFAPTLAELGHRWSEDPQYSHGYLVPAFAIVLLWLRRDRCSRIAPSMSWWGLLPLGLGVALRFSGDYMYLDWLDAFSMLLCLVGLTVLVGGKAALRWAWPAIAFLGFMIPLPFSLEIALAHPLQRIATVSSTYALQTLGFPALASGNVIGINETRIGVVEACSGLSMLVIFFALSTAFSVLAPRPLWQKLLLAASAVPIALIANITRITVTGVMHETVGHKAANLVFHDLAGWLMMPFALILLWLELKILGNLVVEVSAASPAAVPPLGAPLFPVATSKGSKRRRAKKTIIPPAPHGPKRS